VESSVYRRDQNGRIYGTDEANSTVVPTPQESFVTPAQVPQFSEVKPAAPEVELPKARDLNKTKADERLKLSELKLPPVIKRLIGENKKSESPAARATLIAKRIVIFYIVFFLLLGIKTGLSLDKIQATPAVQVEDTAGTNWLLVGSDSREGLSIEEQQQLHTGQDEGAQRTDTIMLVHLGSDGTTLVSLPRDSFVYIPEHTDLDGVAQGQTRNKLNAAYSQGGAPLLVSTVEFNTGLRIDHYMEVGFRGIRDLTDAIGGIDVCVPQDYDDEKSNLHVKAGCQELDGVTALAYVRMRYADPKGDIGRIERQQQYLAAVMKKVSKVTTILNPIAMYRTSKAGTDSVILGKGDGIRDVARLGLAMKGISSGQGKIATVPISNVDANTAAGSSIIWDKEAAIALFAELAAN
jgi:LCP family protein required for cell wall assembly